MVIIGHNVCVLACVCVQESWHGGGGCLFRSMQARIWPSCFTLSMGGVTDQKPPW